MLPYAALPAVVLALAAGSVTAPVVPNAVQVHPRIWVLKVAPTAETYAALKPAGITHVVNVRRDGEPGFDPEGEYAAVAASEIAYIRLALSRTPSKDDLDLFRTVVSGLPSGARILVHCGNGNRAAAATCAFLVLDAGMARAKALATSREAGLAAPETEKALEAYLDRAKAAAP
jgi:protein tyrosine phosphatase (PTP) superfamily phosphohydrolase (DUF442 family)